MPPMVWDLPPDDAAAGTTLTPAELPARLSGTNWSVAVPTPSVGKHTIYAESSQGYATSAATSVTINVTR